MGGCVSSNASVNGNGNMNDASNMLPSGKAEAALTATQRTCLDSWKQILAGETDYLKERLKADPNAAAATIFFNAFYSHLSANHPATYEFFSFGGIQRQARALMRHLSTLLSLKGDSEEEKRLSEIAEIHARHYGVNCTYYQPLMDTLLHSLQTVLGEQGWTADVAASWRALCNRALQFMVPTAAASARPLVVIIGAGFAGWVLAKKLDETGSVRLLVLERKDVMIDNIAGLRAAVQPQLADDIMMPLKKGSIQHGTILQADVTSIHRDGVYVHGRRTPIRYDYLVVATGSSYAFPGKIASPHRNKVKEMYQECSDIIRKAKNIVIAGGGAVGVELAGEIAAEFNKHTTTDTDAQPPGKSITLVHRYAHLLKNLPAEVGAASKLELERMGVRIILNESVELDEEDQTALANQTSLMLQPSVQGKTVRTNQGRKLDGDVLFICSGTKVNARSFELEFANSTNAHKQLIVNHHFQVKDPSAAAFTDAKEEHVRATSGATVTIPTAVDSNAESTNTSSADTHASFTTKHSSVTEPTATNESSAASSGYLSNVFAIGDCCSMDGQYAQYAMKHAQYLSGYLLWRVANQTGCNGEPFPVTEAETHLAGRKQSVSSRSGQVAPTTNTQHATGTGTGTGSSTPNVKSNPNDYGPYVEDLTPALVLLSMGPKVCVGYTSQHGTLTWHAEDYQEIDPQPSNTKGSRRNSSSGTDSSSSPSTPSLPPHLIPLQMKSVDLFIPHIYTMFGMDYANRHKVEWEDNDEVLLQQREEDVRALSVSMKVSERDARNLLMGGTGVMQREAGATYT